MATESKPTVAFDRRQVYRPFLESLNPIAPREFLVDRNLIVRRDQDPHNLDDPPIHVSLASAAELNRGIQMALVGGIGSGKTTELLLTYELLGRHADAVNVLVDLAEFTDLNHISTGAILATAGIGLYSEVEERVKVPATEVTAAYAKGWRKNNYSISAVIATLPWTSESRFLALVVLLYRQW